MSLGTSQTPEENAAVSVKVPSFWVEEPEMWFGQLEGQFQIAGITQDNTKFAYVIGNLEGKYAKEVADIITRPPDTGKYEAIKRQLVLRLSQSEDRKLKQFLECEDLGDRTPSQFLRHLKSLAGDQIPEKLLKSIWRSRLPPTVQSIMATQDKTSLEDASVLADKIYELASHGTMAAVDRPPPISDLERKVDELTQLVEEMTRTSRPPWRGGRRSKSRDRSASRGGFSSRQTAGRTSVPKRKFDDCWYHYKFGDKAHKCIPPCKYSPGN
ncbi:uncharacterized protein LOC143306154 [Osmia lignaria lignaria]|uniref:uncharacterized protein LOC143306154 n=1 Tax=Osmia lignaria lignaria TaxID=1437193 RepID=UPI00402B2030